MFPSKSFQEQRQRFNSGKRDVSGHWQASHLNRILMQCSAGTAKSAPRSLAAIVVSRHAMIVRHLV